MPAEVLKLLAWSTPALIGGTLAGIWLYRRLGQHNYRRLLLLMVLAAGGCCWAVRWALVDLDRGHGALSPVNRRPYGRHRAIG